MGKMTKKIVTDCMSEFSIELICFIPYAYWAHTKGLLEKTISCIDTKPFYYFSSNHEERYDKRDWGGESFKREQNLPNKGLGSLQAKNEPNFDNQWILPPYREVYKNDLFKFNKPLLVISNKFNVEWEHPPLNYLSVSTLEILFSELSKKYKIVYNRADPCIVQDHCKIFKLGEKDLLKKFPDVIGLHEMYHSQQFLVNKKVYSYNTLQLMVYANCNNFISVVGGNAVLASLFGGTNVIFIRFGDLLRDDAYNRWFPKLSGTKIIPVVDKVDENQIASIPPNYDKFIEKILKEYG